MGIHNIIFWNDPINTKELILKVKNKLAGWKANTLSKARSLTLVKANVAGLPNHVMSCLKCPENVIKTIEKDSRPFLWRKYSEMNPVP